MSLTINFGSIWFPILLNVACVVAALMWPTRRGGYLDGLDNLLLLIPALFVSMVGWIIWGVTR